MEETPGKATSDAVVTEFTERGGAAESKKGVADQPGTPDDRKGAQRSHRDSATSSSGRRKSKRRSKSSLETTRVNAESKQVVQNMKEQVEKDIEVHERGADSSVHSATGALVHVLFLVLAILTFLVSLDVLSAAFKLISGRAAGRVFTNSSVLRNPVVALMIGVLVTVMVQSSSSSTSITVSMVGSNLLTVRSAVPIIMGANVGTSVTNTMISLMHVKRRDEFRRGFAAATVHDIFNWLTVLVLLPIEVAFRSAALFNWLNWSDTATGACCFALAVLSILLCFYVLVKVLTGLTQSHVVKVLTVCVNREYSFPASMLVGYLSLLLGCLITFVFQSSSAFTSALLPFAALGMLDLDRVYPLTLGSNVGTTATGLVAALAGSPVTREHALQIALCHTSSTSSASCSSIRCPSSAQTCRVRASALTGLVPIAAFASGFGSPRRASPRRIPLFIARRLGETGAKYRWFVLFYLLLTFVLIPLGALLLSLLGDVPFSIIMVVIISCALLTTFINVLQVFLNEMSFISDPHVDDPPVVCLTPLHRKTPRACGRAFVYMRAHL
ncbi:hypothetical protein HPB52_024828 [Rhipicephalus sanguineus]|uniref:Uncharacterized protein n=1 Tax=Rhipicephalus sanguineus TaxID=34632 RepID=A0A9D4TDU0_RHISA|nr:hypothetical protein HPB52_024828 [Rhipicephalus sanguineus]